MVRSRGHNPKRRLVVCLVESHPLAARYLLGLLQRDPSIEILSEDSVLNGPARSVPKLVFVIDATALSDPLGNYLTVLRSRCPDARTLLLGLEPKGDELRRLPFLEIQGFVSYGAVEDRLCTALRAISDGDAWFAPELLSEFLDGSRAFPPGDPNTKRREILTPREKLIVGLLKRRLGNREIAAALKISESTVKFHLSNIFMKLGVRDRRSAAERGTLRRSTPRVSSPT